jgi:folate-binding protein YgfZ
MFHLASRKVIKITGGLNVLQGIFTADLKALTVNNFTFSAMLNAKGRFLFDFFIRKIEDGFFIDIRSEWVEKFIKSIKYYDLLDEISTSITGMKTIASNSFLASWKNAVFEGREYVEKISLSSEIKTEEEYNLERIKLCLPDGFLELVQEKSIILDFGYDEASGINFNKGCYTGQELMTRTKRTGEVRKALYCIYQESGNFEKLENVLSIFGKYALILGYKEDFQNKKNFEIEGEKFSTYSSNSF